MSAPSGLKYTKDHEWTKINGTTITVGITAFAVEQLGDITLVTIDAKVGDKVDAGKTFGTVESTKTLSDLFAPVGGTIAAINGDLEKNPELVNEDPYGKGWMVTIETGNSKAFEDLLDEMTYEQHVKDSA